VATRWHEGFSGVNVVWYQHPTLYEKSVAASLKFDTTSPLKGRGGESLPSPARNLQGGLMGGAGVPLTTGGESDIESLSWHKAIGEPCGVLSLTLKPRRNWGSGIQPDDVFFVYMRGDKSGKETLLTVVSVDTVGKSYSVTAKGAPVESVHINCRDIGGKAMMDTPTIYVPAAAPLYTEHFFKELSKAFTYKSGLFGGPSLLVQNMITTFYAMRPSFLTKGMGQPGPSTLLPFRFPGIIGESLMSLVDTHTFAQTPMVGAVKHNTNMLLSANNLWSLCDMYANRLVNEMFIDIRDVNQYNTNADATSVLNAQALIAKYGEDKDEQAALSRANAQAISGYSLDSFLKGGVDSHVTKADQRAWNQLHTTTDHSVMALVHRQIPWDTVSFYALPTNVVEQTELYEHNVSRSAREVYNAFRLRLAGGSGQGTVVDENNQDLLYGLTVNQESIYKHGLRRFDGESLFAFASGVSDIKRNKPTGENYFDDMYHYYLGLVTTWYGHNELLWSGSLTMRLRPDIRVGTRLSLFIHEHGHDTVYDYYVQGVEHTY
jgi:hypothetical protein